MKNMPTVWFSLKKSLHCKSDPSEVHDPKTRRQLSTILTRKPTTRSGCSRSISNLRDVIHGGTASKRHVSDRPPSCSPRSIGSSDFLNPISHEVILGGSELKITGFDGGPNSSGGPHCGPAYVGTLRPGTPGPGGQMGMHYFNNNNNNNNASFRARKCATSDGASTGLSRRISIDAEVMTNGSAGSSASVTCHKCGEQFTKWEAAESHHLSKHAVTELVEGDSSRKIVEIICRTSWPKSENQWGRIERVLKVHNMQKTLGRFEDHRETVKARASKLPKKHPRCIADGNELLRFHGTTLSCQLGLSGSSSLCSSERCSVCRIIRHGFSSKKELRDGVGVFTTSTSGRAFESIEAVDCGGDDVAGTRKALIVCRVIAGRVHRTLENVQEITSQTGFDSLAGKVGLYSNIEELYLLNPKALLPCFVVICKP